MLYSDLQDAIYNWIKGVVGPLEVIWIRPNQPLPETGQYVEQFVSLNLTSPMVKRGGDSLKYKQDGVFEIKGQRSANLSIIIYSGNSQQVAIDIQNSTEKPSVLESLSNSGIAIWNEPNVTDLSFKIDSGFEERAGIEFVLGIGSLIEDDVGIIERVEVQGEMNEGTIVTDTIIE